MKQFYKTQIKEVAATLKFAKPICRQLESLWARKLSDSTEYKELSSKVASINISSLPLLQRRSRLLNLTYALIRGKDITKVETNPKVPVEMKEIESFMAKMEQEFLASQKAEIDIIPSWKYDHDGEVVYSATYKREKV